MINLEAMLRASRTAVRETFRLGTMALLLSGCTKQTNDEARTIPDEPESSLEAPAVPGSSNSDSAAPPPDTYAVTASYDPKKNYLTVSGLKKSDGYTVNDVTSTIIIEGIDESNGQVRIVWRDLWHPQGGQQFPIDQPGNYRVTVSTNDYQLTRNTVEVNIPQP